MCVVYYHADIYLRVLRYKFHVQQTPTVGKLLCNLYYINIIIIIIIVITVIIIIITINITFTTVQAWRDVSRLRTSI